MASNKALVPEAKEALEKFKMEAASEVGVNLKQGYNGDLTEDIEDVVDIMIDIEHYLENGFQDDNNYVDLIQTWCQKKYGELPYYVLLGHKYHITHQLWTGTDY